MIGILGARTLLGAPGLTTRSKKLLGAKGIATRNKKLLGTLSTNQSVSSYSILSMFVERTQRK